MPWLAPVTMAAWSLVTLAPSADLNVKGRNSIALPSWPLSPALAVAYPARIRRRIAYVAESRRIIGASGSVLSMRIDARPGGSCSLRPPSSWRPAWTPGCISPPIRSERSAASVAMPRPQVPGSSPGAPSAPPEVRNGLPAHGSSPHPRGSGRDKLELAALIVDGDQVAERAGGETALRAYREVLERHVPGRLLDSPAQLVLVFQVRDLGGDQAQDHGGSVRAGRDE